MNEREAAVGEPSHRLAIAPRSLRERASEFARDLLAGLVAAVLLIANIVSFGALMFPGDLGTGAPIAVTLNVAVWPTTTD